MIEDCLVEFAGRQFECVDKGFGPNELVDVVVRPEDIYIFEKLDAAQISGKVTSSIFKGVHYEMMVNTPEGFEVMIQDYNGFDVGDTVGLRIKPFESGYEGKTVQYFRTIEDKSHAQFRTHLSAMTPVDLKAEPK
jgi:spermidine/putrescine transport system ATP-binding protein